MLKVGGIISYILNNWFNALYLYALNINSNNKKCYISQTIIYNEAE